MGVPPLAFSGRKERERKCPLARCRDTCVVAPVQRDEQGVRKGRSTVPDRREPGLIQRRRPVQGGQRL
eukprot:525279-Heterocapsa_arctica.AAC.1